MLEQKGVIAIVIRALVGCFFSLFLIAFAFAQPVTTCQYGTVTEVTEKISEYNLTPETYATDNYIDKINEVFSAYVGPLPEGTNKVLLVPIEAQNAVVLFAFQDECFKGNAKTSIMLYEVFKAYLAQEEQKS